MSRPSMAVFESSSRGPSVRSTGESVFGCTNPNLHRLRTGTDRGINRIYCKHYPFYERPETSGFNIGTVVYCQYFLIGTVYM